MEMVDQENNDALTRIYDELRLIKEMLGSPPCELTDIRGVATMLNIGIRTVYQLITDDKFPKPIKIGTSSRWRVSHVLEWIDQQETAT